LKYRYKARVRCSSLLVAARRCSSLLVAALTVSLLSGCNLGLQPRGVETPSSSTGAESSVSAGANTWLEWPKSSTEESLSPQLRCHHRPFFGERDPCDVETGSTARSTFPKDPMSSEKVVVDVGSGLDSASIDLIEFDIPIRRYVGDVNKARNIGTLSQTAIVKLAAWDVDSFAQCPEVDEVFLNGHNIGTLQGTSNTWAMTNLSIPIQYINFPAIPGTIGHNSLKIKINTNQCLKYFSTEIDWAKITFEAGPVVVFVHGINPSGNDWNSFKAKMDSEGIVSDSSIQLPYDDFDKQGMRDPIMCNSAKYDSVKKNQTDIIDNLKRIAIRYGTGDLTMVGHSKGGMDGKAAIFKLKNSPPSIIVGNTGVTSVQEPITIQSLVTINTPHLGTPAGDLGIESTLEDNHLIKQTDLNQTEFDRLLGKPSGWSQPLIQVKIVGTLLSKNHVCDLTVARATNINSNYPVDFSHAFGTITDIAISPPNLTSLDTDNIGDSNSSYGLDVWQRLYNFVATTQYLKLDRIIDPITGRSLFSVTRVPKPPHVFETNDVLVTRTSARGSGIPLVIDGWLGIHHTEVIEDPYVQALILRLALKAPSGTDGVNWRKQ
jgi:hypothetical protein